MTLSRTQRIVLQVAVSVVVLAFTAWIMVDVPRLTGSTWHDIRNNLAHINLRTVLAIAALWLAGLACYTIAMTASMPGLSHRRALVLNLSGSSVSNVLPFGGAVGTGLNAVMVRSWRLSLRSFASSTAVLNVVNLLAKLVLPVVAGLVVSHQKGLPRWLGHAAVVASIAAALVVLVVVFALISRGWAVRVDAVLRRLSAMRPGRRGTPAGTGPGPVSSMQGEVRDIFRQHWGRLTAGLGGYVLLQWALFALCMHTAGVLLYRLFVYLAEIPIGALVVAGWAAVRFRRRAGLLTTLSAEDAEGDVNAMPIPSTSNPPTASRR
jgi:hypothetical protein